MRLTHHPDDGHSTHIWNVVFNETKRRWSLPSSTITLEDFFSRSDYTCRCNTMALHLVSVYKSHSTWIGPKKIVGLVVEVRTYFQSFVNVTSNYSIALVGKWLALWTISRSVAICYSGVACSWLFSSFKMIYFNLHVFLQFIPFHPP
jgi:hypothetical protein